MLFVAIFKLCVCFVPHSEEVQFLLLYYYIWY